MQCVVRGRVDSLVACGFSLRSFFAIAAKSQERTDGVFSLLTRPVNSGQCHLSRAMAMTQPSTIHYSQVVGRLALGWYVTGRG